MDYPFYARNFGVILSSSSEMVKISRNLHSTVKRARIIVFGNKTEIEPQIVHGTYHKVRSVIAQKARENMSRKQVLTEKF